MRCSKILPTDPVVVICLLLAAGIGLGAIIVSLTQQDQLTYAQDEQEVTTQKMTEYLAMKAKEIGLRPEHQVALDAFVRDKKDSLRAVRMGALIAPRIAETVKNRATANVGPPPAQDGDDRWEKEYEKELRLYDKYFKICDTYDEAFALDFYQHGRKKKLQEEVHRLIDEEMNKK